MCAFLRLEKSSKFANGPRCLHVTDRSHMLGATCTQLATVRATARVNLKDSNSRILDREARDVLTARESSIGSSCGITEVMIRVHSRKSLYRFLRGSAVPRRSKRQS